MTGVQTCALPILFATDSPWGGQKESLDQLGKIVIDKEDLDKIKGQNAEKLLNRALRLYE